MKNNYQEVLQILFEKRKSNNPAYSLRALARDFEVDPSYLHKLLNGEKKFNLKFAYKLGKEAGLKGEDLINFLLPLLE